jgi:hypothetical protein
MDKKDFFKTKPLIETSSISFIPEEKDFTMEDNKESYLIIKYQLRGRSDFFAKLLVDKKEIEFFTFNKEYEENIVNNQNFIESKELIKEEASRYLNFLQEKYKAHFLKNVFKKIN